MLDDFLGSSNGLEGKLETLRQILNHLVLVLGAGHRLRILQFRFKLSQIRIVLLFLRLHVRFLLSSLLGRLLDDLFEPLSLLNLVHSTSLSHLLDERYRSIFLH